MDDGLVLNLVVEDHIPQSNPVTKAKKGGRWTDRAAAKQVAKRKSRPESISTSHNADAATRERPAKRPRISDPANGPRATLSAKEPRRGRPAEDEEHTATGSDPRTHTHVISSLFTSNPIVKPSETQSSARPIGRPSNAPLADSSTFAGLGLDPLIGAHLSSKMNIAYPTSIQRAALPALLSGPTDDGTLRDVFIQSQTGSGKTLSFLLPIIQDLLPLSSLSYIDRSIGTLAIIIVPTRELAKQISDVLEALLNLRLRPSDESPDGADSGPRLTRWVVSGVLTGGATRTHEKARLRKGVPILVSTPGRLLDHLQNTSSFNVGKCRWLVLDEADRLMELGFEESIQGILRSLEGRRKLAFQAVQEGKSTEVGGWDWERQRRTILCSATIREDVRKLAGTTLKNPIIIKATEADANVFGSGDARQDIDSLAVAGKSQQFTPPSQLSQKYVVAPLKLRLVALVALLRSLLSSQSKRGTKIIVFLSCTDSVDFHWHLFGGTSMGREGDAEASSVSDEEESEGEAKGGADGASHPRKPAANAGTQELEARSPLLPGTSIFRLHGSLPLRTRLASLRGFSSGFSSKQPRPDSPVSSILLCTSVASRGLDLPLVRAVVQYDLPTEGGATEYVHRVGRTARVGKGGEAWSIVAPSEVDWVKWVEDRMRGDTGSAVESIAGEGKKPSSLQSVQVETVLRNGFGGKGSEYEERATEVQLSLERWVLKDKHNAELARKAFRSHMRAYATHPSNEKHIFHIRHLHLGHLAKAFALREAPNAATAGSKANSKRKAGIQRSKPSTTTKKRTVDAEDDDNVAEAERRMEKVVREQGRLTRKGGKMVSSGAAEFQIAGGYDLEKLAHRT
ncbi:P-loop containing nucleoside triphosphate hydrolase protein [Fomitopsis serialis]|uniref:P-loop containing nucleoside triphosphate hydrolase protein n=1 Tax=Fomitopsis serialis TaxID=139415 RepID=UPI0020085186|nr:P-loop containing nucleoside triphosphate hydrolase protein [Neoantrodia serialis]KAH9935525.1 P-loop containing nucleoside triphosphate hydrolase protein [Neoantrodia serialis]